MWRTEFKDGLQNGNIETMVIDGTVVAWVMNRNVIPNNFIHTWKQLMETVDGQ